MVGLSKPKLTGVNQNGQKGDNMNKKELRKSLSALDNLFRTMLKGLEHAKSQHIFDAAIRPITKEERDKYVMPFVSLSYLYDTIYNTNIDAIQGTLSFEGVISRIERSTNEIQVLLSPEEKRRQQ
jgi:hypothetical protein